MGKLRIEPKIKPILDEDEFKFYKTVLHDAKRKAQDNNLFWDLDQGEDIRQAKKAFAWVAEKEGISLTVRAKRGSQTLTLNFKETSGQKKQGKRISAEECVRRITVALRNSDTPLNKSQIVSAAAISSSTWNVRVKEMLANRKIAKKGSGRQTTYYLP
jgi:hypothetical protein